ncbi:cupin domain-containing protein [Streptomyces sp. T-3]|nr:cupin domain-containing protein [Streptomyces sp. T-3]
MTDNPRPPADSGDEPGIFSLGPLADDLLRKAAESRADRSAKTVFGGRGHVLGQTLLALGAGSALAEHTHPGEATVLVVRGRVQVTMGGAVWEVAPYDLLPVPPTAHGLMALEDSVVLLTVVKRHS